MTFRSLFRQSIVPAAILAASFAASSAWAAPIDWASWSNVATGSTAGSATLTFSTLGVTGTYSGELESLQLPYPSYTPVSTFSGGSIDNTPPSANGIIQVFGGTGSTRTVTFSQAIVNPVMAIWSLGQGGINAQFAFDQAFTIQSGGPSAEYGGSSITSTGNTVFGSEGNGTIQFQGTFNSITWTNPVYENWYGFTVGATALAVPSIPEPETYALMLGGLGLVGFIARRRKNV